MGTKVVAISGPEVGFDSTRRFERFQESVMSKFWDGIYSPGGSGVQ
jgi:hypothetical protein